MKVDFKHVKPGDPMRIPASTFNTMVNAVQESAQSRRVGAIPPRIADGAGDGIILLENTTAHDLDQYEVLALDAPIITAAQNELEFRQRVAMTGIDADINHRGRFAVAVEPIGQGAIGLARISGPMIAQVNMQNAGEAFADLPTAAGSYNLVSGLSGSARILWAAPGTGLQLAVVELMAMPTLDAFRIGTATRDGTNNRWTYAAARQMKTAAGYGNWLDSTTDTTTYTLYNAAEDANGSSGTYGNGISQTNIDAANAAGNGAGTFVMKAVPTNTIVWARPIQLPDGTLEWWIVGMPNGVDGACG